MNTAINLTIYCIWAIGAAAASGFLVFFALYAWDLVRTRIMGRKRAMLALHLLREHERKEEFKKATNAR